LHEELPLIRGNAQQLGQVIINLLMNACQALPSRDRGIRLATDFNPLTAMVTITVEDEGCGIPADFGQQIMEPFFTTRLDSGGTGLGLSICRSIVAEHGGALEFVSVVDKGTIFTVKIPALQDSGQESGR
jgi:signal transduction histidine kinase